MEYTFSGRNEYTVKSFKKGEDCLELLNENPDLIILDHSFFLTDSKYKKGLDILKEIRSQNLNIPVIILTGEQDDSIQSDYDKLGVSGFIIKDSFFIDSLIEKVDLFFKQK